MHLREHRFDRFEHFYCDKAANAAAIEREQCEQGLHVDVGIQHDGSCGMGHLIDRQYDRISDRLRSQERRLPVGTPSGIGDRTGFG
jgi:hypothetical protein